MDDLFEKYQIKIQNTSTVFVRSFMDDVNWNARLIGIKGARGVGKTTLLLQYMKLHFSNEMEKSLYVSLDSVAFTNRNLVDLADQFVKKGGRYLFLDEVHKYANWSQELKNIYDDYPELKVVFTGSSLLEILNARADLSRRAIVYHMQGLSFREYLSLETGQHFKRLSLEELLENHLAVAKSVNSEIKPFQYFETYLQYGYYPFFKEQPENYAQRLEEIVNMMLEIELPLLRGVDLGYIHKVKQLLAIISESVPFIPNVSNLSAKMGINRATLMNYLYYLAEIGLTINLYKEAKGNGKLQKPSKIYLDNTNLMYILSPYNANVGTVRETFFANQLGNKHHLSYHETADFFVDETYSFEVGGKDKSGKQIQDLKNAFIVSDDIEYGYLNKIPLWLFGFLY